MTQGTMLVRLEQEDVRDDKAGYTDKRQHRRHRRRFSVRFTDGSDGDAGRLAFTEDISRQGMFIKTGKVPRIGVILQVSITIPAGEVELEGKVMWGKRVHPTLVNKMNKAGMGILITCFRSGREIYLAACDELESR